MKKIEELKKSQEPVYWEISIKKIAREVIDGMGIPPERLYSMTRERRGAYGRGLVAYLSRKLTGLQVKEIARYFYREPMTVSLAVTKIERLLQKDKELARGVEAIENGLRKKGKKKYFITIA